MTAALYVNMPTSGGPSQQAIPKAIRPMPATRYWYCDAGELLNQQQLPDQRRSGQQRQSRRCGSMTTRLLKEAILLAAELEGRDGRSKDELVGFLRRVANEDIRAFAMLLGRVLSLQVEARTDMSVEVTYKTVQEVRRELDDRGISIEAVKRTALVAIPDRFSRMIATNSHSSSTIRDRPPPVRLRNCRTIRIVRGGPHGNGRGRRCLSTRKPRTPFSLLRRGPAVERSAGRRATFP